MWCAMQRPARWSSLKATVVHLGHACIQYFCLPWVTRNGTHAVAGASHQGVDTRDKRAANGFVSCLASQCSCVTPASTWR
jgi:hypothetical protein